MIRVDRTVAATVDEVFAVLSDGWLYPLWVVGATHMRDVDEGWPAVGTRLHHAVGAWPLQIRDSTVVLEMVPQRRLELRARVWPVGTALVSLDLEPVGGDTRVVMGEIAEAGPAAALPAALQALTIKPRNRECLSRLEDLAVHRAARH